MASKIVSTLSRISLGFVLVIIFAFLYIKAETLFPVNTELWKDKIQTYIIFTAFIFAWDSLASRKTERALFKVGFLKAIWKLPLFTGITLAILYLFSAVTGVNSPVNVLQITLVTLGVALFFIFVVAFLEQIVFFGWMQNELTARGISKNFAVGISLIAFASFHWWQGGEIILLAIYLPLGYVFHLVKEKYSPQTHMADSGVHGGYDIFVTNLFT